MQGGRLYSSFDACKVVGAGDEDVFDGSVLEFVEYEEPAFRALTLAYVCVHSPIC